MIRVCVVDDHAVVRVGIAALIATTVDITVVGEAADGERAVELVRQLRPDVVMMDLSMPGLDTNAVIAQLGAEAPATTVLVLTSFSDRERVLGALRAGARGFLLKHGEPEVLLNGIRQVAAGWSPLDPKAARILLTTLAPPIRDAPLTNREHEVLILVGEGQPNRAIAQRLGVSERTVKAHLTSIYRRLGVTDRTRAALWVQHHLRTQE